MEESRMCRLFHETFQDHEEQRTMSDKHEANLVVSVESRKGGVGKTTAAFCLARFLSKPEHEHMKDKYNVLFIDLDITGTNAADIDEESYFWKNDVNVIKNDNGNINLIQLFMDQFMTGKGLPKLEFVQDKINIIGSQIYRDLSSSTNKSSSTSSDKNSSHPLLVLKNPGILFDNIHSIWLLEFIQKIIQDFVSSMGTSKKTAVILDNSPGFVGISPEIHEWLTDWGPDKGKFLMVTSPDKQDLKSCGFAVEHLHDTFKKKWNTSVVFHVMQSGSSKDGDNFDLKKHDESFFMRLATSGKDKEKPSCFYSNTGEEAKKCYQENPSKYIAAIINRMPSRDNEESLENITIQSKELGALLKVAGAAKSKRVIYNDKYLTYQFDVPVPERNKAPDTKNDYLQLIRDKIKELNESEVSLLELNFINFEVEFEKQVKMINDVISALKNIIPDYIINWIEPRWKPDSIVPTLRSILVNHLKGYEYKAVKEKQNNNDDEDIFKSKLENHLKRNNSLIPSDFEIFIRSLVFPVMLAIRPTQEDNDSPELIDRLKEILTVEIKKWIKKGKPLEIQQFLASETINENDYYEFFKILNNEGYPDFKELYKAITSAQARLIDLSNDSRFILELIEELTDNEIKGGSRFPYIDRIADDVIIRKTIAHKDVKKKLEETGYYSQFDAALEDILKDWGICE